MKNRGFTASGVTEALQEKSPKLTPKPACLASVRIPIRPPPPMSVDSPSDSGCGRSESLLGKP